MDVWGEKRGEQWRDGEIDTAHKEGDTEWVHVGIDQGPNMIVVDVTYMAKEEVEDPTDEDKDVSHDKNHQQPVKPCLVLWPGQEADTKSIEENTKNCPQKSHPANDCPCFLHVWYR